MKANAISPQPDENFFPSARTLSRQTIKPRRYAIVSGVSPHSEENLMANPLPTRQITKI